ncbi:MAG: CCA tRNA nucleotidyltransferase [Eubacterium sp.]|nr:CCA tRNA nucleotidyltransferase [Eubacterium sp.]
MVQIPEKVEYILDTLKANNFEGYAVGGCVRDSVLGRTPGDWDITTSAKPEEVKQIFRKTVDTGIEHGTVTVIIEGEGFEVTTYRVDGEYEDHRHPTEVEFTPDLKEDLKRRDFTINAMAYNPEKGIVDLFDGIKDLRHRCIRCVGEPEARFSEDALRMLRGIRFAGQLDFTIEERTLQAIQNQSSSIGKVSVERIRTEITKLLLSKKPDKLLLAERTGLCESFLPEFTRMLETVQNNPHHSFDVGYHSLLAVRNVREIGEKLQKQEAVISQPYGGDFRTEKVDTILVFAALLHDVGKPLCKTTDEKGVDHFHGHAEVGSQMAHDVMRRLRFDNDTVNMVTKIVRFHERRFEGSPKAMRRLMSQAGIEVMPYLFIIQEADILSQSEYMREEKLASIKEGRNVFAEILRQKEAVCLQDLQVTGKDLLDLGVSRGPQVGKVLRELLEVVIDSPEKNNRKLLLTEAKKRITIE